QQSGRKESQRVLNLRGNQRETWVWTITGRDGFDVDKKDLLLFLGYKPREGRPVEGEGYRKSIVWSEKYVPGLFGRWWASLRKWVASILVALLSITNTV